MNEACATTEWGEWSICNPQCGKGKRMRQRNYINQEAAEQAKCRSKLTQRKECYGDQIGCDDDMDIPEIPDPECAVTEWTTFSACSAQCGQGIQTRTRQYINRGAGKRCR